jgi:glutathione S-transferase
VAIVSPALANDQKFFVSFFQKRNTSLLREPGVVAGAATSKTRLPPNLDTWHSQPAAKLHAPRYGGTNMMMAHRWTALVTLLALLVYFWMSLQVGRARGKCGIKPPAMTGDELLERAVRVQSNTLEWLPIFLVSLWLFAVYWNELVAAAIGIVWIIGRLVYSVGYMADPAKRSTGFLIQLLACAVLLFGALGKIVYSLATGDI